jgi:hypothetical protein
MKVNEFTAIGELTDSGKLEIFRSWECCGNRWTKNFPYDDLEAASWTPVCPSCGGFDGTLFI